MKIPLKNQITLLIKASLLFSCFLGVFLFSTSVFSRLEDQPRSTNFIEVSAYVATANSATFFISTLPWLFLIYLPLSLLFQKIKNFKFSLLFLGIIVFGIAGEIIWVSIQSDMDQDLKVYLKFIATYALYGCFIGYKHNQNRITYSEK